MKHVLFRIPAGFKSLFMPSAAAFLLLVSPARVAGQQLSGNVAVPADHATVAAVVQLLNLHGVGPGGVNVLVSAGHSETAPAGGIVLGSEVLSTGAAAASAARPVVFQKSGTGANPLVRAFTPGTGATDGIFILAGVDYVTISQLDLQEHASNINAAQQMEWGYALVKRNGASPFDGCHHIVIRNCTVTLNKGGLRANGIYGGNHVAGSTSALGIREAGDAHQHILIEHNTLRNMLNGIYFSGYNDTDPLLELFDSDMVISGNDIRDFGNTTTTNVTTPVSGIYLNYFREALVRDNIIHNASGGDVSRRAPLHGVYLGKGAGSMTAVIANNIVIRADSTGTIPAFHGIRTGAGLMSDSVIIMQNTLSARGGTGSASSKLIAHDGAAGYIEISRNVVEDTRMNHINFKVIENKNATPSGGAVVIRDNTASGPVAYAPKGMSLASPDYIYFIENTGDAHYSTRDSVKGNRFSLKHEGSGLSAVCYGILDNSGTGTVPPYPVKIIRDNEFTHIDSVRFHGVVVSRNGSSGGGYSEVSNNIIRNVAGIVSGIHIEGAANQRVRISDNYIDSSVNQRNPDAAMSGILVDGGERIEIFRNHISNLKIARPTYARSQVRGIYINSAGQVSVYNNMITRLDASASNADNSAVGIGLTSAGAARVWHNTVYLKSANSNVSFGASGVYFGIGVQELDLRNNIVHVDAVAGYDGVVAALRRSEGMQGNPPANLSESSNNNVYWVPPGQENYIYAEGVVPDAFPVNMYSLDNDPAFNTGCGVFRSFMQTAEQQSYTENNLHEVSPGLFAPANESFAEGLGRSVLNPPVHEDITGVVRKQPADAGAMEFEGMIPQAAGKPRISAEGNTVFCAGDSLLLRAPEITGAVFTWFRDGQVLPASGQDSLYVSVSGVYAVSAEYTGCLDTSDPLTIRVNPLPEPEIVPGDGSLLVGQDIYVAYQWLHEGEEIEDAIDPEYELLEGGEYTLRVTDTNGCTGISKRFYVSTGVAYGGVRPSGLSMYPNPARGILHFRPAAGNYIVRILSVEGKELMRREAPGYVDLAGIAPGTYLVTATDMHTGALILRETLLKAD